MFSLSVILTVSFLFMDKAHAEEGTVDGIPYTITSDNVLTIGDGRNYQGLSGWNVNASLITNKTKKVVFKGNIIASSLYDMFSGANNLSEIQGLNNINTSDVGSFSCMFKNCTSLKSLDLRQWNVQSATDMSDMFYGCKSLKNINVSTWNTENISTTESMFYGCSSLTTLDLSKWDTSNLKKVGYMFYGCSALRSVNIYGWNLKPSVGYWEEDSQHDMFYGANRLERINLGKNTVFKAVQDGNNYYHPALRRESGSYKWYKESTNSSYTAKQMEEQNPQQKNPGWYVYKTGTIVKPVIRVTGVSILPTNQTLTVGQKVQLRATIKPSNTTESKIVSYSSRNNKIATVTSGGLVTAKASGTTTIVANCHGKTATTTVKVVPKPTIKSISLKTNLKKLTYYQGQSLNTTGGVINVKYSNGKVVPVTITSKMCTGYNKNKLGTQKITVTYSGKKTNFTVKVIKNTVSSISVKTNPKKTTYIKGQNLNVTGGAIYVKWASGAKIVANLTAKMCTGYNKNKLGNQKVTVTYNGRKTNFTVKVINNYITSISMKTSPKKTIYVQGQDLNVSGGVLNVNWASAAKTTVNLTTKMCTGYNKNKVGNQKITVTYNGKKTNFTVKVNVKALPGITVKGASAITQTSVRLKASLSSAYKISEYGVYLGTNTNDMTLHNKDDGSYLQNMMFDINGLLDGKTYYYYFYYKVNGQTKKSVIKAFKTRSRNGTYVSLSHSRTISDGDYYILAAVNPAYGVSIDRDSKDNGANAHLYRHIDNYSAMIFHFSYVGDGYYKIKNKNSGKCLDVKDGAGNIGQNVWQYLDNNSSAQQWNIVSAGNGAYYLVPKCGANRAMDINNMTITNDTNIQIWAQNGTNAQKFILKPVSNGITLVVHPFAVYTNVKSKK